MRGDVVAQQMVTCGIACTALALRSPAQPQDTFEDLLAASAYELELSEGRLDGPGAELLAAAVAGTQFVVVGEEHYVREVPQLVTALFALLQEREGYQCLAIESDPLSARVASSDLRGDEQAIVAYARRYPYAFTFPSVEELAMIADVGRLSAAPGDPVWGLDQAFGASHALAWLLERTEDSGPRASLEGLLQRIATAESVRSDTSAHFMSERGKPPEFYALRELVPLAAGSDAAFVVDQLLLSDAIYRPYTDPEVRERRGAREEARHAREQNMKHLFMREYRRAQTDGGALPKVLVKAGHWHTAYGRYPRSKLLTLGNFLHELATSNDLGSFSIGIAIHGPPGNWREIRSVPGWERVADFANPDVWTLFDLRPLRIHEETVRSAAPALADFLWQFDAALFMGGARPATLLESGH